MNAANILLVAKREMLQIMKMRSFWLTLLILPAAIALGPLFGKSLADTEPTRVAVVDRSGAATAESIRARFAADETQYLLRQLARYVQRYGMQNADPAALWAKQGRWYTPAEMAAFEADGGIDAALRKIEAVRPEGVPQFDVPVDEYSFIEAPAGLTGASGKAFDSAARRVFADDPEDTNPEIIVLIPDGYPADIRITVYSADNVPGSFVAKLQDVLTADLRRRMLAESG